MDALTQLSEHEQMFQQEIGKFARNVIGPKVLEMDENEKLDPEVIKQCFEMGLMGIEVDEKYGGTGSSFFMAILAIEELSKVDPAVGVFVDVQNTLVNNIFSRWATESQKDKYFPAFATSKVGCFCLTEPNSGSDAFAMQARAVDEGDHWLVTGKKCFITNANEAEVFIVFANIDPSKGYKGITAFIVEKGQEGLSIGKKEKKLGIRASSTCEVILEKVKVAKDQVLGEVGKGYKIAIETLNEGRIGIGAQMLGLAHGAFMGAFNYARERKQFGKQLNEFQGVQFLLAELYTELEAAKLMVYNAARLKENGYPFTKEAAIAKLASSNIAEKIASSALEVYGGYGYIKEFPAEKFYRDVKIGKLYEGTSNLQKQTIFKYLNAEL